MLRDSRWAAAPTRATAKPPDSAPSSEPERPTSNEASTTKPGGSRWAINHHPPKSIASSSAHTCCTGRSGLPSMTCTCARTCGLMTCSFHILADP
eukprot:360642-Chlamydomonas_euryale.AAC.4